MLLYNFYFIFRCRYLIIKKKKFRKRIHPQSRSFERRICAQTQDLLKKFNVSNKSERCFPQHCILSSTTLHSRSLPLTLNRLEGRLNTKEG